MLKPLKDINNKSIEFLQHRILRIVERNQAWLASNPAALQWLMCHWDSMFYAGRICYGYGGIIKKGSACENNPKYEVGGRIKYQSEEIENIIYDAWANASTAMGKLIPGSNGMGIVMATRETFEQWGREYVGLQSDPFFQLSEKPNKTFDEWVELCTDTRYRYHSIFPDRFSVANHLLAVNGTGMGWNKAGFVCDEGPADNDEAMFNGWPLVTIQSFPEAYQSLIEEVIYSEKVQKTIAAANEHHQKLVSEENRKKGESKRDLLATLGVEVPEGTSIETMDGESVLALFDKWLEEAYEKREGKLESLGNPDGRPPRTYYPFSKGYCQLLSIPENAHPSYIWASKEIVEHVLQNQELYDSETVKDAKLFYKQAAVKARGILPPQA